MTDQRMLSENPAWRGIVNGLLVLISVILFGWTGESWAGNGEKPVAKVNQAILTRIDLERALNEIMPAGVFHGGFSSEKRASYRPQAMDRMIEKELFFQEAVRTSLEIDQEVIAQNRERMIKKAGSEKAFIAALKRAGIDDQQYREKLIKKHLTGRLIDEELTKKPDVTDEMVKNHFEANRTKFMRPEARGLWHILVKVNPSASQEEKALRKARALEALEKIQTGEDMSKTAWEYSDGPYRVKGGKMGLVHKGRLVKDLEKVAFKLKTGEMSGLVETMYGYHIVQVKEIKPAEQLELKDVATKIKKRLTEKRKKQLRKTLIQRLRDEARIEVY